MKKKIFLNALWKPHSLYKELVHYPPEGYELTLGEPLVDKTFKMMSKMRIAYSLQDRLSEMMPLSLIKAYLDKFVKKRPKDAVLTYACELLVFRKEPWIVDIGDLTNLVGGDYEHFQRYKPILQRALASKFCKKIICFYEVSRVSLLSNLDCSTFEHKIEVIPLAVHKREFIKHYNEPWVKLLFVGSANIMRQFETKGGKEVVEAFIILKERYNNLELVIRSDMPKRLKDKYAPIPGLRIIDKIIPEEELEQEFKSADIFVFPAHFTACMVMLEAMSYELPIVTTNVYANPEIVKDGITGLIINKSERVPYYRGNLPNMNFSCSFLKAIKDTDPKVVEELVKKLSILIENPELRRTMGKAGRKEVEEGRFSIKKRNEKLKKIFDEATTEASRS
ncbi:glycosyltransferase family 4 protein [Dehalococcoidia bacterium]|nr:glycosyltransferase family 4 protein [Dehalococcoidia bacterium]